MIYSTLADKTLLAHRLQKSLHNTSAQLELEKASSMANDNRIKSLEEIIIELEHDPKDPKGIQALIKKKEEDIAALRRQLRLPATLHPQTTEVAQQKEEEDVVTLLMKMHKRLIETENALEASLQGRQGELASQPVQTTHILTAAPPTATTKVPPIDPTSIAGTSSSAPVSATTTAAAEQEASLSMEEMMKQIKALEVQMAELKEAKETLAKIEVRYDKSKMDVAKKTREVKALEKRIKALEKELTLEKTLAEVKKILWAKIGQSITDQWQSIEIIHEQMELIGLAQFENQRARASLGNMPEQANRMIQFLNTHTKEQLAAIGIRNKTDTILLVKRVLTLRNFVQNLERKFQEMQAEVNDFRIKFSLQHYRAEGYLVY